MSKKLRKSNVYKVGDVVAKRSGKPFQNGEKLATIRQFDVAFVPAVGHTGLRSVDVAYLEDMQAWVEVERLVVVERPEAPIA